MIPASVRVDFRSPTELAPRDDSDFVDQVAIDQILKA
jgi:hypothetical protein